LPSSSPSEFLKPLFVVSLAWLISLKDRDASLPVVPLSGIVTGLVALLLMQQPNLGETVIFCACWVMLLALAGVPMRFLMILGACAMGGVVAAYFLYDVATVRIDAFLFGAAGDVDTYQTDSAMRTLTAGGLFGTGPGGGSPQVPAAGAADRLYLLGHRRGVRADRVPCDRDHLHDDHRRVLVKLLHEDDRFLVLATAGLVGQFGLQAMINMCVNVQLAPSKGMTLPFISYGGSSMIALSIGFGLLLAFTAPQSVSAPLALCGEMERQMSFGISRHYVLAAGGTGGHMIPAHALAEELRARGHHCALVTDDRGARIPGLFDGVPVHILPAGRLSRNPIGLFKALKNIAAGTGDGVAHVRDVQAVGGDRLWRLPRTPGVTRRSA
jgi:hypothetical protein